MKLSTSSLFFSLVCSMNVCSRSAAFVPSNRRSFVVRRPMSDDFGDGVGRIERLEFTIFPDGRVEEKVLGVKGSDCTKITEAINAQLGKVVSTTPTEEMFEQSLRQDETLYDTDTSSTW